MIRIGLQWFLNQTGDAASSHLESGGFARTTDKVVSLLAKIIECLENYALFLD